MYIRPGAHELSKVFMCCWSNLCSNRPLERYSHPYLWPCLSIVNPTLLMCHNFLGRARVQPTCSGCICLHWEFVPPESRVVWNFRSASTYGITPCYHSWIKCQTHSRKTWRNNKSLKVNTTSFACNSRFVVNYILSARAAMLFLSLNHNQVVLGYFISDVITRGTLYCHISCRLTLAWASSTLV